MRLWFAIGAVALGVGIGLARHGYKEWTQAAQASTEPEAISLKNLLTRGATGNPNILLTDFAACEKYAINGWPSQWQRAWVPVVPREELALGQQRGQAHLPIRALILTKHVGSSSRASVFFAQIT
jgi:hypothetical protein